MADIALSKLINNSGLPRLAADLTFPSKIGTAGTPWVRFTGINAVGALTPLLSLTGKHAISYALIENIDNETITIKLTIDGAVKWNDTYANTLLDIPLIGSASSANSNDISFECNESFLLELQTTADSNVSFRALARPIE